MSTSRRFAMSVLAVSSLFAGSLSAVASSAVASTPPAPAADLAATAIQVEAMDAAMVHTQTQLDAVAERVRDDLAAKDPDSGFAGVQVDAKSAQLTIWWHGAVPIAVRDAVQQAPKGLTVRLLPAAHSRAKLVKAADGLTRWGITGTPGAKLATRGVVVDGYSPRADGSGVDVEFHRSPTKGVAKTLPQAAAQDEAASATAVPTTMTELAPPVQAAAPSFTRLNDDVAWRGGSLYHSYQNVFGLDPVGGLCSTGFAVIRNGERNRMLSAAHCFDHTWSTGKTYVKDFDGQYIAHNSESAPTVAYKDSLDSSIIRTDSGTRGEVYSGLFDDAAGTYRGVIGDSSNNMGDIVSSSGGNSGVHNYLRVVSDYFTKTMNGVTNSIYVLAEQPTQGLIAVAQGDSGGPVYSNADCSTPTFFDCHLKNVSARGTMSFLHTQVACPRLAVSGVICGQRVGYMPIRPSLAAWGATIQYSTKK